MKRNTKAATARTLAKIPPGELSIAAQNLLAQITDKMCKGVIDGANAAMDLINSLQDVLADEAPIPRTTHPLDVWIKITPGCSLPHNADLVDVYFESSGDVERASYDADDSQWRSSFTCRVYPPEQIVTHWRIGSRPR